MKRVWRTAIIAILALLAMALAYIVQYGWLKDGWPLDRVTANGRTVNVSPVSRVMISEVMSSNKTAHAGADGLYSDWVELYNSGDEPCDITGWTLTDDASSAIKFTFPEKVLQSGECVVVYLTDELVNEVGKPYQAPFKLSSNGDALMLYDEGGFIMEAINVPALSTDTVYARVGSVGKFIITKLYTPGLVNTNDNYRAQDNSAERSALPVEIVRVMPSNKSSLTDSNGNFSDWVEIRNTSQSAVSLANCGLSDDMYDRFKWRFPDKTLGVGESTVVFCNGVSTDDSAAFRLSSQGETVILTDPDGLVIDMVEFGLTQPDQVLVRQADGSLR